MEITITKLEVGWMVRIDKERYPPEFVEFSDSSVLTGVRDIIERDPDVKIAHSDH